MRERHQPADGDDGVQLTIASNVRNRAGKACSIAIADRVRSVALDTACVGPQHLRAPSDEPRQPYPMTPAMAPGMSDIIWEIGEIVKLLGA